MRSTRLAGLVALVVAGVAAAVFVAGAAAGQLFREQIVDEVDTFSETDFCGVDGLTADFRITRNGWVHAVTHGKDQLPYFGFNLTVEERVTNADNDNFVVALSRIVDKDLRVTDNGDGTLTILVLATGNGVLYDSEGNAIARNPGQVRFEILIDHGGTPADPSDDEFLEFLGQVKGSTGRNDDYCEAAVPRLLGT